MEVSDNDTFRLGRQRKQMKAKTKLCQWCCWSTIYAAKVSGSMDVQEGDRATQTVHAYVQAFDT